MAIVFAVVFAILWLKFSFWTAAAVTGGGAFLLVLLALPGSGTPPEGRSKSGRRPKDRGFDVKAHLRITYEDRNESVTTREIVAKNYLDHSPGEIYAYCKLRRAHRTFVTSRIKDAVDLETGEVIKRLPTFFRERRVQP